MTPQQKFKSYPVEWTGRMAPPGGKVCSVAIKDISKNSVVLHHAHALAASTFIKLEIHASCSGEYHRIRVKGQVFKNNILSQNRGAAISIMLTQISAKDAHLLNNILHFFENSSATG